MCHIPQLVSRAKELGMDSLAITDHGVMYGVIEFYLAAKEAGIKPIIGCEVYVAQNSHLSRTVGDKDNYHLILLAKNQTGYRNLIQLTTKAHLDGFYYKPRLDRELLQEYHHGLIALSACIKGEIPQLILARRFEDAKQALEAGIQWKRHLGLYAYRLGALKHYTRLAPSPLEQVERLEQLRILENGGCIAMAQACTFIPPGIDTADDLERTRELF